MLRNMAIPVTSFRMGFRALAEIKELNVQDILDYIDDVVNSAGEIPGDEALDINVAVIKNIVGGARKYIYCTDDFVKKSQLSE